MYTQNDANNSNELPEISQMQQHKKTIIISMIVAIIGLFTVYYHTKSNVKIDSVVNENYSPQNENSIEVQKEKPVAAIETQKAQLAPEMMQAQIALIQEKQKELQQRLSSPLMVVNNTAQSVEKNDSSDTNKSLDPNTQFLNQLSQQEMKSVTATKMGSLNSVIAEGSLIHAILESATNSDLPGYVRAIVSDATFSEDGSHILVPPGSRLIGQYKSGMMQGQSRIYIVWTRLITPEGVSVNLGSPGVDNLGVAGMGANEIDRHFWERFGTASLLSLIGAGASNTGLSNIDQNNSSLYREAVANSFSESARQSLKEQGSIAPTLKTYQGKPIIVFVAHDIHFENVLSQYPSKLKIF